MSEAQTHLAEEARALGPWFHNLHCGVVETAPVSGEEQYRAATAGRRPPPGGGAAVEGASS